MFQADNGRQLIAWRRRLHLIFCGYSEAEISQLGDLTKITNERMNELIHSNKLESTEKVGEESNKTAPDVPVGLIDGHVVRNVYLIGHLRHQLSTEK